MTAFAMAVSYSFLSSAGITPRTCSAAFWSPRLVADRRRRAVDLRGSPPTGASPRLPAVHARAGAGPAGRAGVRRAGAARGDSGRPPAGGVDYARAHKPFVVGAAAIAALGLMLASGLMLMLRHRRRRSRPAACRGRSPEPGRLSGSGRAPRAARRRRWRPGEDEQQVREPVEVADRLGVAVRAAGDRGALGPTADGAADVEWAADGVPPGSTNDFSGSSVALTSSQRCSSQAVCSGRTRSRSRSVVGSSGAEMSAPTSNRSFWMCASHSA